MQAMTSQCRKARFMPRSRKTQAQTAGVKRSERETVVTLRLPRELHEQLKREADAAGRGFAAEVRRRLEGSLFGNPEVGQHPQFGELLSAIMHAAGVASKTSFSAASNFQPYNAFAHTVPMLVDTFRPEDVPPPDPQDWWQGNAYAAAALHAMGRSDLWPRLTEAFERRLPPRQKGEGSSDDEPWPGSTPVRGDKK